MSSRPRVSIVVPCFNQGPFLTACLESLIAQTVTDWEAIIIDDGSTTGDVRDVVETCRDPRFRVIRHDANRGAGAARNTGFSAARADLVLPLDCDDLLDSTFLATTTEALERAGDADCVFTDFQLFGSSDAIWRYSTDRTLEDMFSGQWIPGPGTLMRRAVWERAGGYSDERAITGNEDWDFWIGALGAGLKPLHIPVPLYWYRQHEASTSAFSRRYEEFMQRELIYRRHRGLFDEHGGGREFRVTGYLNSARFAWRIRQRRRAIGIVWLGIKATGTLWPFARAMVAALVRRSMPARADHTQSGAANAV